MNTIKVYDIYVWECHKRHYFVIKLSLKGMKEAKHAGAYS